MIDIFIETSRLRENWFLNACVFENMKIELYEMIVGARGFTGAIGGDIDYLISCSFLVRRWVILAFEGISGKRSNLWDKRINLSKVMFKTIILVSLKTLEIGQKKMY